LAWASAEAATPLGVGRKQAPGYAGRWLESIGQWAPTAGAALDYLQK
jgi:hypothetical protein